MRWCDRSREPWPSLAGGVVLDVGGLSVWRTRSCASTDEGTDGCGDGDGGQNDEDQHDVPGRRIRRGDPKPDDRNGQPDVRAEEEPGEDLSLRAIRRHRGS